jgi:hypothetical protein
MAKTTIVKIPTLDNAPLSNVKVISGEYFKDKTDPKIGEKISFISDWCNVPYEDLAIVKRNELEDLFDKIISIIASYKPSPPKQRIANYVMIDNYAAMPVGWHHHIENVDLEISPLDILGLIYLEEGMGYAETDKYKNIINPAKVRSEEISKLITLKEFLDINGFFLNIWQSFINLDLEAVKKGIKKKKKK